jgi:hypothetical protein
MFDYFVAVRITKFAQSATKARCSAIIAAA